MFLIFVFGALLGAIVFVLTSIDGELIVTINSKYGMSLGSNSDVSKAYVAKRKKGRGGYSSDDWDYYNDSGDIIEDKLLIKLIYNTFSHEDWYGEYAFYVNDEPYYSDTTSVDDVNYEENIVNSIEEMKEIVEGTTA
jgi:hypothetical protein